MIWVHCEFESEDSVSDGLVVGFDLSVFGFDDWTLDLNLLGIDLA